MRYSINNHYHDRVNEITTYNKVIPPYLDDNEEIEFDLPDEYNEFNSYVRVDSYLSTNTEFTNFYLLNLILKIKINFKSEDEYQSFLFNYKLGKKLVEYRNINSLPSKEIKDMILNKLIIKEKDFYSMLLPLHFNLQYAILAIITQKKLNIFSFDMNLMMRLSSLSCEDQEKAAQVIDYIHREHFKYEKESRLLELFDQYFDHQIEMKEEDVNLMRVRIVEVTPNIIKYKTPVLERVNHILRKYKNYKDHFLKINFVGEEGNKLPLNFSAMWMLLHFMQQIMLNSVIIGSRNFQFLSSSNSQMKHSSFWFFNPEGTRFNEIVEVINELGDFSEEENIHKNAARRGQCLSTTTWIKSLSLDSIKYIDDIGNNDHIYTDGIGQISTDLSLICSKKFDLTYSSAFQIRLGGIKGIVAVNPELTGEVILVRPSMLKFKSNDTELGVIRCSSYSQGYLNRQIIVLLATLGVPNEILLRMLKKDMKKFNLLLNNPNEMLKMKKYSALQKCFHFQTTFMQFANNDYNIKTDPFLSSLSYVTVIARVADLKNKGKIMDKHSAVLIGVIDETGTLKEGEVFIQIKSEFVKNLEKSVIVKGDVIVTKNPCLHPGDIKVLKSVEGNEKLLHMVNVIVFPACGKRPIQNEISGGDLDGDSYFVSWNINLISTIKLKNISSLEEFKLNSQKPKSDKVIRMKDIITSYIDYMKYDTIALISNLHSAYADSDVENYAFNEKCLKLAEFFNIAIDAPKTGNFVRSEDLKPFTIKSYPDYLEMPSYSNYRSPGILGELYRHIDLTKYIYDFEYNEYEYNYMENYILINNLISENAQEYVLKAYDIYNKFKNEIYELMRMHKVLSENELLLGENIYDRKRSKQIKHNDIFIEVKNIKEKYRNIILSEFYSVNFEIASAFYIVTYLNNKTVEKYRDFFAKHKNFRILIDFLIKEKRLFGGILTKQAFDNSLFRYKTFEEYRSMIYSKKDNGYIGIISKKRIFSFPWLIKEIREPLLRISNYNN